MEGRYLKEYVHMRDILFHGLRLEDVILVILKNIELI